MALLLKIFATIFIISSTISFARVANAVTPGAVQILATEVNGEGCPQGSVRTVLAPDGSSISLLYDRFVGQLDPAAKVARVVCDVRIKIRKPPGQSFAFTSADFRGFINLEAGAVASQRVRLAGGFDENGKREVTLAQQNWMGPITDNYILNVLQPVEGVQTVGCQQAQRPQTMIRVRVALILRNKKTATGSGMIAVDSFDGGMVQRYGLSWSTCL